MRSALHNNSEIRMADEFSWREVYSAQTAPHENLRKVVAKHMASEFRKPLREHNIVAFDRLRAFLVAHRQDKPLILDSCCGTGMSTRLLAEQNPDSLVIGVDQSLCRLEKHDANRCSTTNYLLLRANCEDIWRLCVDEGIIFSRHFILYPNPYPKPAQLKRRWHAHPVFPILKDLTHETCVRSNWRIYLEEFRLAWEMLTRQQPGTITLAQTDSPLTLFERKYAGSGQTLFELRVLSTLNK